jgi:signal transduction histidine kinase
MATSVYGTKEAPYLEEYSKVAISGETINYETYYAPMEKYFAISVVSPDKNRFATISTDITESKRIQGIIDSKNKELEQIVYVASHDLRSPLVNVDGFSRELSYTIQELSSLLQKSSATEDLRKPLQEGFADMENSIERIRSSALQMDKLLKGLLNLSRQGRVALQLRDIDMNSCIHQLSPSFAFILEQTHGTLTIDDLPPCRGDELQISQVFSNLIDNAIKYRHPDRPPHIRISGSIETNQAVYRVSDNGMGIAQNHIEHVFELFHRLHPDRSPGEGLGLTIVRQSLSRMYGSIKAESKEDEGSVFTITIPPAKKIPIAGKETT